MGSNVLAELQYLHHSLRHGNSKKYILRSLDILLDILQTNYIFYTGLDIRHLRFLSG
jgi:hypothetical protein